MGSKRAVWTAQPRDFLALRLLKCGSRATFSALCVCLGAHLGAQKTAEAPWIRQMPAAVERVGDLWLANTTPHSTKP